MKFLQKRWKNIILTLVFLIGLGIFTYPLYQDAFSKIYDQHLIRTYQRKSAKKDQEEMAKLREKLEAENERLKAEQQTPADTDLLAAEEKVQQKPAEKDFFEKHTLGVLTIPAIKGQMPIFDTGSDVFLSKGAAHLKGTALPIGGEGHHSVIMAHRGLPEAELFSKLPQLKDGDEFFIEILGEKLAYEVDQIKVIEPDVVEDLMPVEGKDYVTLLTCTPYMVNSHRLLVRGHRIPYVEKMQAAEKKTSFWVIAKIVLTLLGIVLVIVLGIYLLNRRKKQKRGGI